MPPVRRRSGTMGKRNEWEEFFDGHAPAYNDNSFTQNTMAEVDFLIEEFRLAPGSSIIDIGCGTGRHSIELAKRGYRMTGVELSSGMLAEAGRSAEKAEVEVEWLHADATRFASEKVFDAAICLCEGAFGLLGRDGDPIGHSLAILRNISAVLKPHAKAVFTVVNGFATIRQMTQQDVEERRFDPLTMAAVYDEEYETPEGKKTVTLRERGFIPTELVMMFDQSGFRIEHLGGGTAGNWGRRAIDLDEIEVMVIASKRETSGGG